MQTSKHDLTSINTLFPDGIDLLLCSSSFEERCLSIPKHLDVSMVKHAVIAEYIGGAVNTDNHLQVLRGCFQSSETVGLDPSDPVASFRSMMEVLGSKGDIETCVVDITTFTRETLLILFGLFRYRITFCKRLIAVYNGAEDYSLGEPDENKWLSKGIREVRSVLFYPGDVLPSRKLHLIVLAGFESERAAKLIDEYEPSLLSLGYGSEDASINPQHYHTNRAFHEQLAIRSTESIYGSSLHKFEMFPNDPHQTKAAILARVHTSPGYNVVVAAMNTKISTLGAALAAFEDERLQICYAQPMFYNSDHYSFPQVSFYLTDISEILT